MPNDLAELADGLIVRDPKSRLNAESVAERLQINDETRTQGTTQGSKGSQGSVDEEEVDLEAFEQEEIVLIGREKQLAELEAIKQQFLETRQPQVVWITGLSGEGKSSLVEKFLLPIRRGDQMLVLSGRCYDRESVPFKAVDSIIDPLVAYLRSSRGKWLESQLPEDILFLAQLFPLLRRVEAVSKQQATVNFSKVEPEKLRARGFYALRDLLVTISQRTPVVILIDDLQWADADSAYAWTELLTGDDPPAVLFLGGYRSDEAKDSSYLQTWRQRTEQGFRRVNSRRVQVEPLTREQCIELAVIRTGANRDLVQNQADELFEDTGGNPYFLEQLLEGFDAANGSFRHVPMDELIVRRLARLPAPAADLLKVIAVSGQPIAIGEACDVIGNDAFDLAIFTHMRSERLVRLIGNQNQSFVDTYHDKIRETVLAGMTAEQLRRWHLRLAETIEDGAGLDAQGLLLSLSSSSTLGESDREISHRVFDLAHHYAAAGDHREFVYQLLAAEQSLKASAEVDALGFYKQAERNLPSVAIRNIRFRLWFHMGLAYRWNRAADAAIDRYQSAAEVAESDFDRARAYTGIGHAHRQVSRFDEAIRQYESALQELGERLPRSAITNVLSIITTSVRVLMFPVDWHRSANEFEARIAEAKQDILLAVWIATVEKDIFAAVNQMIRAALVTFQIGETRVTSLGYAALSNAYSALGFSWIGNLCLKRSARYQAAFEDVTLRGTLKYYQALTNYWGGTTREAERLFEESIPLLRRSGSFYEMLLAAHMLRHARAYVSSAGSELRSAQVVLKLATDVQSLQQTCWGTYDVASAQARTGNLAEAVCHMKRANLMLGAELMNQTEAIRGATDAFVHLQCSDYGKARELAVSAWQTVTRTMLLIDTTLLCLPLLIESVARAEWTTPLSISDSRYLKKLIRRSLLLYPTIPNQHPHLQRAYGRAKYGMGKTRQAIRHFEKAIRLSEQKGMDFQRARSLLDLAAVKEEERDENRTEAICLLKEMESVIPRAESWLLGDQYDEAVVAPEFDLEAWEREHGSVSVSAKDKPTEV